MQLFTTRRCLGCPQQEQMPAAAYDMRPTLLIILLIAFTACSAKSKKKRMAGTSVTTTEVTITTTVTTSCEAQVSQDQQHLYDMPLKGVIYWLKSHLQR